MNDELSGASRGIAIAVDSFCRVETRVTFTAMFDPQLIVVAIRLRCCNAVRKTVIKWLIVLQPCQAAGFFVQLDLEGGIIASYNNCNIKL